MARDTGEDTEGDEGIGLGERVTGGMRRAAGALGRAARSAMGKPEAGNDLLFQALHAEHEEVGLLLQKLLASTDRQRANDLWKMVSLDLTAHVRAEEEVVYSRLEQEEDLTAKIDHAYDEHDDIERLIAECDAMGVGTDEFCALVAELDKVVRNHVDEEEGDILQRAARELSEHERDMLVVQFRERKMQIIPQLRRELIYARGDGPPGRPVAPRASATSARPTPARPAPAKPAAPAKQRSEASARRRTARRSPAKSTARSEDLSKKSLTELREMAGRKDIRGRSKMDRKELMAALRRP